jgi:CheY-like chemotaxis protein
MAHVLVVDDEDGIRTVLARLVSGAGHTVTEAPDADAALRALETREANVALCDVRMPGHDGLWLVDEIRRRFPAVGLLFVTAETRLPPASTLKEGVVAHVLKPFNKDAVLAAIGKALAWNAAARISPPRPSVDDALTAWLNEEP